MNMQINVCIKDDKVGGRKVQTHLVALIFYVKLDPNPPLENKLSRRLKRSDRLQQPTKRA